MQSNPYLNAMPELTAFQRYEVRREYRFLRLMGVDRVIAKGSVSRMVHLMTCGL